MIKKHLLFTYFILTFIFSWAFWSIPLLNAAGIYNNPTLNSIYGFGVALPIITSSILTLVVYGAQGLRELYSRFSLRSVKTKWYIASLLMPVTFCMLTVACYCFLIGSPGRFFELYSFTKFFSALPLLIIFALLEEVGWRGFALPRLREKFNPLAASVILGAIWGIWHFPKLMSEGTKDINSFIVMGIFVILLSVFITWIYENSNGSITLAILTHAAVNASIYGISNKILIKIGYNKVSIIYIAILMLIILILLFINGERLKWPNSRTGIELKD